MPEKIIVSGTGCCLVDLLYNNISFRSSSIKPYLSLKRGDGGLDPGKLVFREEFENFGRIKLDDFVTLAAGNRSCDKINIGGPSIVALIHAAQLVNDDICEVRFYGRSGNDGIGSYLLSTLEKTPVIISDLKVIDKPTPSTVVLSDPDYDHGHGERMFINTIGAAWHYSPADLDESFFKSHITVFGGTALVPGIHDSLSSLLRRSKNEGCLTLVNTVFDFRNEKRNPSARWPLGESDESYIYTDLLVTDFEEALRLSGTSDIDSAAKFFSEKNVSAFIITNGASDITLFSDGRIFNPVKMKKMPVSDQIRRDLSSFAGGDTTGCGDNFVGGIIASLAWQMSEGINKPDLTEACCWGIVSGSFACFYMGGTFLEKERGEKLCLIRPYYDAYKREIRG